MNKKKISRKRDFILDELQPLKVIDRSTMRPSTASKAFEKEVEVAQALLECLIENDTETFMEILDAYLCVNRTKIAQRARLTRATVTQAFSKKGNPTLKTIAKIVHESVAARR